jgi:hypothetical protein
MEELIEIIPDFPDYQVTSEGRVLNGRTRRSLKFTPTTGGALTVTLILDGKHYCRSVKVLVARAFVDGESEYNDTAIVLDGDEENLSARNIRWRGKGFAWEYKHQFTHPDPRDQLGPVSDLTDGRKYETCMDVAVIYGCLCRHVRRSIYEWMVEPVSGHRFAWLLEE